MGHTSSGNVNVKLSATITLNSEAIIKDFTIVVIESEMSQDQKDVNNDTKNLSITPTGVDTLNSITNNFTLLETGVNGSIITWVSDSAIITILNGNATVTRPEQIDGDATVLLTATITKNSEIKTKDFTLTVLAINQDALDVVTDGNTLEANGLALEGSDTTSSVTTNFTLPVAGATSTTISWVSNNSAVAVAGGNAIVSQPSYTDGDTTVTLTATVELNGEFVEKEFIITVPALPATDLESVTLDKAELESAGLTLNGSDTLTAIKGDFTVSTSGTLGSAITWSSDSAGSISISGGNITVTRPSYTDGNKAVVLTATVTKGAETSTVIYNIVITKLEPTDLEAIQIVQTNLVSSNILFSGSDVIDNVTSNFTLPTSGDFGTSISWNSDVLETISITGANATVSTDNRYGVFTYVNVTATIERNGISTTKTFTLSVTREIPEWTIMVYLDADNDLEQAGLEDFNEMEKGLRDSITAGNSDINNINIIVLLDRATGYAGNATESGGSNWTDTRLYRINPDSDMTLFNSERLDDGDLLTHGHLNNLGEKNVADPTTLSWFMNYGKSNFPANNYSLILWNHGGGARSAKLANSDKKIEKAICWDEGSGGDALYLDEVQQAISNNFNSSDKLNLLGFDACLMGTVEVAYEFRDLAEYMVGSMNNEQGDGWWYDDIFGKFTATTPTPKELSKQLVISYRDFIENELGYSATGETLSAIDLSKMETLKTAIDNFALSINNSPSNVNNLLLARNSGIGYFNSLDAAVGTPYFDLYDIFNTVNKDTTAHTTVRNSANNIITALSDAVVYAYGDEGNVGILNNGNTTQPYYLGTGLEVKRGLSIFFSLGNLPTGTNGEQENSYMYQWWYTDANTQFWADNTFLYGQIDFCTSNTNGIVESWRELMEAMYDTVEVSPGQYDSPNTPGWY